MKTTNARTGVVGAEVIAITPSVTYIIDAITRQAAVRIIPARTNEGVPASVRYMRRRPMLWTTRLTTDTAI